MTKQEKEISDETKMIWTKEVRPFPPGKWMFGKEQMCYVCGGYVIGRIHAYAFSLMIDGRRVLNPKDRRWDIEFKTLKEAKAYCEKYEERKRKKNG